MTNAPEPTKYVDDQIRSRLDSHEVRYTSGRRLVISALESADGPRSAAELHSELGSNLPLSSLYRSLAVMAKAGVLDQHNGTKGLTRYELAEWLQGHHHHLVCLECGSVEDVELPGRLEGQLVGLISDITSDSSFEAAGHSLEIDGRCQKCA